MFSWTTLCVALLCSVAIFSTAAPLSLRADTIAERELVPVVPGTQIQPPLVDLLDQYENLQQQFDAASPDDPNFNALSTQLTATKTKLDKAIKGVAVLTTADASTPTDSSASDSPTSPAATTAPTASASTTSPPSNTINTNVPVVTVVTQVGTSIVVVASEGVTSTITLATITAVQSGAPSSSSSSGPSPVATGSGKGANPRSTSVTSSTSPANPTVSGKSANASVGQPSGSGALALAPQSVLTIVLGGSLLGMIMAL